MSAKAVDVYLEAGEKRVFAGVLDWPGWCRSGRDRAAALQALIDYADRYAAVVARAPGRRRLRLAFTSPQYPSELRVVHRLKGDATTDFGAPSKAPSADRLPLEDAELERQLALLQGCWKALDAAASAAAGKTLRKGPRGGGRELEAILSHVLDADAAYLRRLGHKHRQAADGEAPNAEIARLRREMLKAIASLARGEPVPHPRRSGSLWTPRYALRRVAWHALDHAWEIEDRADVHGGHRPAREATR